MYRVAIVGLALPIAIPTAAQDAQSLPSVERGQFVAQMDAEFTRLDGNGDGMVTAGEIALSQQAAARAQALTQNREVFGQLDADGNGMLDPQEFARLVNVDGVAVDPAPLLDQFDGNGDGTITLIEYRVATQGNFDRIDTDRDGTITPMEMRAGGIVR